MIRTIEHFFFQKFASALSGDLSLFNSKAVAMLCYRTIFFPQRKHSMTRPLPVYVALAKFIVANR